VKAEIRRSARTPIRRLANDAGTALIEFAIVAPILVILLLNLFDFSSLIWAIMETDYSAQVGAQAAFKTCASGSLPAMTTGNCPNLTTAITTAMQSTSLGTNVSLSNGYPGETYYCTSGTTLQSVGTYSSPPNPFDCSSVGNPGVTPGDYIQVQVTYSYSPIFAGLSLASSQTLIGTAMERLQ
jgi:Flp pilus assembly protein TadG